MPLGVAEDGVGLAYNKFYDENTPDDVKASDGTGSAGSAGRQDHG